MSAFTDLVDYVLDQVFGYQDANEIKENTESLRDAMIKEHQWNASDSSATEHGHHQIPATGLLTNSSAFYFDRTHTMINLTYTEELLMAASGHYFSEQQAYYNIYDVEGDPVSASVVCEADILTKSIAQTIGSFDAGSATTGKYLKVDLVLDAKDEYGIGTGNLGYCSFIISGNALYVTATPPHYLFHMANFGYFLFCLRDKVTKKLVGTFLSQDPHWFGTEGYEKDDPVLPLKLPHPFPQYAPYTDKSPDDDGLEIVLIDMRTNPLEINEKNIVSKLKEINVSEDLEWLSKSDNPLDKEDLDLIPEDFKKYVKIIQPVLQEKEV